MRRSIEVLRQSRDAVVDADDERRADDEDAEREKQERHYRTSVIPSNMSVGR